MIRARWGACLLALALAGSAAASPDSGDALMLRFKGVSARLVLVSHAMMPGEVLDVSVTTPGRGRVALVAGDAVRRGGHAWRYRAPDRPGAMTRLTWREGRRTATLQIFVMRPFDAVADTSLNGYDIGRYVSRPYKGLELYTPPRGLIEVTPDLLDLHVSPNFRLKEFLCKQPGGYPRYLLLRTRLLLKLEYLLARAREAGLTRRPFTIMSGYRTPRYNSAIGNRTIYSRHLYGGAADIFIDDAPRDGVMDDLNGDGRIDLADATVLYDLVVGQVGSPAYRPYLGGLARYPARGGHGPFLHVDVRGVLTRWGE